MQDVQAEVDDSAGTSKPAHAGHGSGEGDANQVRIVGGRRVSAKRAADVERFLIDPTDKRHGKLYGYTLGCRKTCCREAKTDYESKRTGRSTTPLRRRIVAVHDKQNVSYDDDRISDIDAISDLMISERRLNPDRPRGPKSGLTFERHPIDYEAARARAAAYA